MSNREKISEMLGKKEIVYLIDDFEEVAVRLVQGNKITLAFAKRPGKKEYSLSGTTDLVNQAEMGGEIVAKKDYDNC